MRSETVTRANPQRSRSNAWLYFLLAYGWSWLVWSPPIIFGWEWGEFRTLISYALGIGPLLAALVLVYRGRSDESPAQFWERVTDYRRVSAGWWLLIVMLPFGMNLLARIFPTWRG